MTHEHIRFNGNANEYAEQMRQRRQQRLTKKYWDGLHASVDADRTCDEVRTNTMNSAKSKVNKQQEFDRAVVEASEQWDQEFQSQDQQVDAHFQELEALIDSLQDPAYYDVSGYGGGSSNYADEQIVVDDSRQNIEAQRRSLEDLLGA